MVFVGLLCEILLGGGACAPTDTQKPEVRLVEGYSLFLVLLQVGLDDQESTYQTLHPRRVDDRARMESIKDGGQSQTGVRNLAIQVCVRVVPVHRSGLGVRSLDERYYLPLLHPPPQLPDSYIF